MLESISVIITCRNLERYIGAAIESVLNQEYAGPVEVVVIDDCSNDRSADIIKSYPQVRYLPSEQNLGVLMATVLGLKNTTGELVFFLDGDDIWEPSKLSATVMRFRAEGRLALVTHDLNYIDSTGRIIDRKSRVDEVMAVAPPTSCKSALIRDGVLLHRDYVWLGSAFAINRALSDVDGFCSFATALPDPLNTYQDWPLAFWVACRPGVSLGYVPCKLFRYRLHGANHSGDATSSEKAIRNVRRTRNTMAAMLAIAERFNADHNVLYATQQKLGFYTYLCDLYGGDKWRAAVGFLNSLPYLMSGTLPVTKEVARFLGVQLLGAEGFTFLAKAKQRLRIMR